MLQLLRLLVNSSLGKPSFVALLLVSHIADKLELSISLRAVAAIARNIQSFGSGIMGAGYSPNMLEVGGTDTSMLNAVANTLSHFW